MAMRSMASLVGLLVALGGGYFVYHTYFTRAGFDRTPPQEQIDVVGIRSQLLVIGQAEKQYVVAHSTYGTLEQLQQDGPPSIGTPQRGYTFAVSTNGSQSFTATATPEDANKAGWPTLVLDASMQVSER
jgi:type IV minor pilin ComP (DNA uptake receptor)